MRLLRPLIVLFVLLAVVTGVLYPALVTGIGAVAFRQQAAGSLIRRNGAVVGSALIGQSFQGTGYFWGRLSATAPMPNNAAASGGSNFGPLNPALVDAARARIEALHVADPDNHRAVPIDLVTASASGLDPDISPAAALFQVDRIARQRHLDPNALRKLVLDSVEPPQWHLFGEPRVNVLLLNLALDRAQ